MLFFSRPFKAPIYLRLASTAFIFLGLATPVQSALPADAAAPSPGSSVSSGPKVQILNQPASGTTAAKVISERSFVPDSGSSPATANDQVRADIYSLSTLQKLGRFELSTQTSGTVKKSNATYFDSENKVVVTETSEFNNDALVNWTQEQKQVETKGRLVLTSGPDGIVKFEFTKGGLTNSKEEKAVGNFVSSPSLVSFIQKNWDSLNSGATLEIRFGVLDRLESVGFKLAKVTLSPDQIPGMELKNRSGYYIEDAKVTVIKMSASNFLIAAIVQPLFFAFDSTNQRLVAIRGRTAIKKGNGGPGNFSDQDALTVYKK